MYLRRKGSEWYTQMTEVIFFLSSSFFANAREANPAISVQTGQKADEKLGPILCRSKVGFTSSKILIYSHPGIRGRRSHCGSKVS